MGQEIAEVSFTSDFARLCRRRLSGERKAGCGGEINTTLLYPPHTVLKTIKHVPKTTRPSALNAHLFLLSIQLSAPSKETRPNHNIVKALLVFWFKSLFTLFAEYSSAVTGFRQTLSPERGLPQPDLSCWAVAKTLLSLAIKWNPAY